jgi:hypothetical protein
VREYIDKFNTIRKVDQAEIEDDIQVASNEADVPGSD